MDQLRSHGFLILLLFSSMEIITVQCTNDGWPMGTSGLIQTDWTGTWHGTVEVYPEGQFGAGWHKTLVIGPYPMADETCTIWNGTFTQQGVVQLNKNYRFCRGQGATDLYIDEGNGETLTVQWINDILIASFKTNGLYGVSTLRMRDGNLVEEIILAEDKPGVENKLVSLRAQSIHHIEMQRISDQI